MKKFETNEELLAKYYDDITKVLIWESDEDIAKIYCEINSWKVPDKLKGIAPYIGIENTYGLSHDYYIVFKDIVEKIIPEQTITKVHIRNLSKRNNWSYGNTYLHFNERRNSTKKRNFFQEIFNIK